MKNEAKNKAVRCVESLLNFALKVGKLCGNVLRGETKLVGMGSVRL